MSATGRPPFAPICASDTARFTDTVVLPTPPLPLDTATVFLNWTPCPLRRTSAGTFESHLRLTCVTPGNTATAARASLSITSVNGQAGGVSTTAQQPPATH